MTVSESISGEVIFLGSSLLLGVILFFLYDLLRIFRRIVPHGVIWIGVEDFIYWMICTGAVFVLLYQENDGMVRGFALGGLVIGMLVYYATISRLIVTVNVRILKLILGLFQKVVEVIFHPFFVVKKKTKGFFGKRLKKLLRAVKIGLCKL